MSHEHKLCVHCTKNISREGSIRFTVGEYRTKSCLRNILFYKKQETKRERTLAGQIRGPEHGFQDASKTLGMVTCAPVTPALVDRERQEDHWGSIAAT